MITSIASGLVAVTGEVELSAEDFTKLFGSVAKLTNSDYQLDAAAQVFDRVRD
jgi:hypothetical protein